MDGTRLALIIANDEYDDPGLRRLEAPAHDARALAEILGDPGVGDFDVRILHNATTQEIRAAVEDFFIDRKRDDLLLLHFSCHGLKNADGELFLALRDTRPDRLGSTGLPADYVNRMMAASRAQRIALFLDCCYGGAFPRGMLVRAAGDAQIQDAFAPQEHVGGERGRVVVTASNAMQYSFEAGELSQDLVRPSVFTGALVDALSTGEADKDADGWIAMTELFSFVTEKVRQISPNQNPQMWTFGAQGDIIIARSRMRRVKPTRLEPELRREMNHHLPAVRYGLVHMFQEWLGSESLRDALAAHHALTSMADDDSRKVSDAAKAALIGSVLQVDPPELDLSIDEEGETIGLLTLSGPPIATAVTARVDVPWMNVEFNDPEVRVHVRGPLPIGESVGTLTLTSPIGQRELAVRVNHAPFKVLEADPDYKAATRALSREEWERAVEGFERLLRRYPGEQQVMAQLAEARQGRQASRLERDVRAPVTDALRDDVTEQDSLGEPRTGPTAGVPANEAPPVVKTSPRSKEAPAAELLTTPITWRRIRSRRRLGRKGLAFAGSLLALALIVTIIFIVTYKSPAELAAEREAVAGELLSAAFPDIASGSLDCDEVKEQVYSDGYQQFCHSSQFPLGAFIVLNVHPDQTTSDDEVPDSPTGTWGPGAHQGTWGKYDSQKQDLDGEENDFWTASYYYADTLFELEIFSDFERDLDRVFDKLKLLPPSQLPHPDSCCDPK